jgi:hypothetical protein
MDKQSTVLAVETREACESKGLTEGCVSSAFGPGREEPVQEALCRSSRFPFERRGKEKGSVRGRLRDNASSAQAILLEEERKS